MSANLILSLPDLYYRLYKKCCGCFKRRVAQKQQKCWKCFVQWCHLLKHI